MRDSSNAWNDRNPAYHRERYNRLVADGLCVQCGHEPTITGTLCFDCASKRDDYNTNRLR